MKKLILLFVSAVFVTLTGFSQRFDYERSSNVFFGLNMGSTWQTSDVTNVTRPIGGAGFIFGGTIGKDYGRAVSFDLRLRYLGGNWFGQDSDTTGQLSQNIALSNAYGANGTAVQNFKTNNHSLSLELAMHANRFRERTGWDPYIFAGIGGNASYTQGNLFNEDGVLYDYSVNPTSSFSVTGYDTPLDVSETATHDEDGIYHSYWAPSLGMGIGYYFGNRFSVGLEHKTTFTRNDYFDGTVANQSGEISGNNDLFHYTNFYLRWYLRKGNRSNTAVTPPAVTDPNVYNGTNNLTQKPVVNFTNPNTTPRVANSPTFVLRADILHVESAQNVTFRQDGTVNPNYTFNSLTTKFQSTVQLNPGQNVFSIRGTNQHGSDEETVVIIFERDEVIPNNPPIVTITDPAVSPHTTSSSNYIVNSTIVNVSSKNQVNITVNNSNFANFGYSQLSANQASVTVPVALIEGVNTIIVTATNGSGQDTEQATIIKKPVVQAQPPVVSFFNPSQQSITVNSPNFNLVGQVLHVDSKNNVAFFQNGNVNQNFTFNAANKSFSSQVILVPGQNIFQLVGSNSDGTDQKSVVINYNVSSRKPPIVTITNPAIHPFTTTNNTHNLIATVLNVTSANQINMTLNGAVFSNFTFSVSNSQLNASLPLQEGMNTVKITGTNADGSDSKQAVIIYKKPAVVLPPVVEFVNPAVNPYQTNVASHSVVASVFNVETSNQINVNFNGQTISNFTFNAATHIVTFNASLIQGANTITITGTNSAGVDSENQTIVYIDPATQLPPVVTYLDPAVNPLTVFDASCPVMAKVQHVTSAQNIVLKINGVATSNFTYSLNSELMNFTTSLLVGANILEITATNNYGQDIKSTTIIFRKPNLVAPPEVTITIPANDPYESALPSTLVNAKVLNVASAQDISVEVNGVNITPFSFSNTMKIVSFTANLVQGNNTVKITGTNAAGTASDTRTIVYNPAQVVNPPYVTFIHPNTPGTEVAQPNYQLVAHVLNVEDASGINVVMNGQAVNPALYTFNPGNNEVTMNSNLNVGNNTFYVQGTNSAGSHSAITTITYKQPVVSCDEPEISFIAPASSPITIEEDFFDVHALIHNVTNANQISLNVNGYSVGNFMYSSTTHELIRKVDLAEGNNVIEIVASNNCGVAEVNTLIIYHPVDAPCDLPTVAIISPAANSLVTQDPTTTLTASVTNVQNANQISVKVNGAPINFSYDAATNLVSVELNLNVGGHNITIDVANECGSAQADCRIKRETCNTPEINVSHNGVVVDGVVSNNQLVINGTISYGTNVEFRHNSVPTNYVYDIQTGSFSAAVTLTEGVNNFVITSNNNCGDVSQNLSVTYTPVVAVNPPTVEITTPATNPYETTLASSNIIATSTNVSQSSDIAVTINGSSVAFNFNAVNGQITFTAALVEGANEAVVTVLNPSGTASDNTTIIYTAPVTVIPPVVAITTPSVSPMVAVAGAYSFQGTIDHLEHIGQAEFIMNGQVLSNVAATMNNGIVNFNIPVALNPTHPNYELLVIGTNSAGTAQDSGVLSLEVVDDPIDNNCMPNVGAQFTNNNSSVIATSTMDLSNVVLQYSDGTTQKFDGLSGLSQTFSGTGVNAGKCITGVWIKSGCNQSGDGPGYGEWVPNNAYDGSCETTPCTPPTILFQSPIEVTNSAYTLQAIVTNAVANNISLSLNGTSIPVNFNVGTNLVTAPVNLSEGQNTFVLTANECEVIKGNIVVNYTVPCEPISYSYVYPAQTSISVSEAVLSTMNLTVNEVSSDGINVTLNGTSIPFTLNGTSLALANISLTNGMNNIIISLNNNCSNEVITYNVNYTAPLTPCGPRINPGNAEWQFCLVTPSGTYNRNDLASNPNFNYTGSASSVYFLPIAGGGDLTINGNPYPVQNGTYYLIEGNINITVSSSQPGAMGHWTLCIDATTAVVSSGKGNNRPPSPCDPGKSLQNDGGSGTGGATGGKGAVDPGKKTTTGGSTKTPEGTKAPSTKTPPTTTRTTGGTVTPEKTEGRTKETEVIPSGTRRGGGK